MDNIILIGMMGCGKTTVGKRLADALGRRQVDTDQLIEEWEGRTVAEIFAQSGEAYFRAQELAVSRKLAEETDLIISCGGGLPLNPGCMDCLRQSGQVFWLDRDPNEIYDSLDVSGRPLAQQGREAFCTRYAQRKGIYADCCDRRVCGTTPQLVANQILEIVTSR